MAESPDLSTISKLQFHYWFSDKTHTMDAMVHNKCEREVLEIAKIVAKLIGVSITIETEPSAKGGLKSWLTLTAKSPKHKSANKIALVNLLVLTIMVTSGNTNLNQVLNILLNNLFADREIDDSQRQVLAKQIDRLKEELVNYLPLVEENSLIKKRRSNYYDLLRKNQKVKSLSIVLTDNLKKPITEEQLVSRDNFKLFKVTIGSIVKQVLENIEVEIISPVLVKGNHKWKGTYKDEPISFTMKADEFMVLVQSGKVEFKSGSSINCKLEIEKKVNSAGIEKISGYNIIGVESYSENGKTMLTPETKQRQKETTISKKQLDLFG
jgi:hypothetical protein